MKRAVLSLIASACTLVLSAQIPNPGFENWVNHGTFQEPVGWASFNNLYPGIVVCMPSTDATQGQYSLKLQSVFDPVSSTVIPGWIFSGYYDSINTNILTGFPYNQRPLRFKGDYKYTRMGSDVGAVVARLTKWDPVNQQPINVGQAFKAMNTAMTTWFSFSINFTYFTSDIPDTCSIILNSSNVGTAVEGTNLLIDNLALEGPFAINEVEEPAVVSIFPNPSAGMVHLLTAKKAHGQFDVAVIDVTGKKVRTTSINAYTPGETIPLDLNDLAQGLYTLEVVSAQGLVNYKLQIAR